jgi:exonuclease SbcD
MKLLHISDWHVGLTTGPHARRSDHEKVFAEIVEAARHYKPDLILHTGDVFHFAIPAVDDMNFGLTSLQELAAHAPVIVLRGNHDSDKLFRIFSLLLRPGSPLTFVDLPPRLSDGDPIIRRPADGGETTIALAPLPFVHQNRFVQRYLDAESQTVTFADSLGKYERTLGEMLVKGLDSTREVAIFAAHQFVQGAYKSGSERAIHVGDDYATRAGDIPAVSYAAFGHIHRPQEIAGSNHARYAGSPIQIDYGEEGENKSIVFVEARPRSSARVEVVPLTGGRPLLSVTTNLAELATLADRCAGRLCKVTVRTEMPISDLAQRVADGLPEASIVDVIEDCAATRVSAIEERDVAAREQSLVELFDEFLAGNPVPGAEAARVRAAFHVLHATAESAEEPSFEAFGINDPALVAELSA